VIELNPARAGIGSDPADHRWSSYRRNALGGADAVLTEQAEYTALGGSLAAQCGAYRELIPPGKAGRPRNKAERAKQLEIFSLTQTIISYRRTSED